MTRRATGATFAIGVGSPGQLITEWSSADPTIARVLTQIAALPYPERFEAEGQLHLAEARWCFQRAATFGMLSAPGRRGPYDRTVCPECGRSISLAADRSIRPHGPIEARCPGSVTPVAGDC